MRKLKGLISLTVAAAVVLGIFTIQDKSVYALSYKDMTSSSIEAKKEEVADAKAEQTNLKNSISSMKEIVAGLASQKANLDQYITKLDSTMADIQSNIKNYELKINEKEAEIKRKENELIIAIEQEEVQYETMQQRIQYLYERGESSYIETLLGAKSFADMLNRAEYVEAMTAYDNQVLHEYMEQREYVQLCKDSLELEKDILKDSKSALETEKANLVSVREQKAGELAAFEHDISLTEAQLKELEADLQYQTNLIKSLEKEITEEQKAILAEKGMNLGYNGSGFCWPAPNYTKVSSDFGWRKDPFTGLKAYHNGVDLAAKEGTPILAAYDGIVVAATYNSSMGNYIYIEHGDGLRTIYLHASKLHVKKDDVVKAGDLIAAVGTTGRSTGPHLHFSVRLNGEYVSPWNYLSK